MLDESPEGMTAGGVGARRIGGRFGLGILACWLIVECLTLGPSALVPLHLLAVLAPGLAISAVAALICASLCFLVRATAGQRPGVAALLPALSLTVFLATPIFDLFAGEWVSRQSWTPLAKPAALLLAGLSFFIAGRFLIRRSVARGKLPVLWGAVLAAGSVLCFFLDGHEFLARKYLAAHDILGVCGLVAAGLASIALVPLGKRAFLALLLLGLAAVGFWMLGGVDTGDVGLREVLLRKSRLSGRVMAGVLTVEDDATDVDSDLLRALQKRRPVDQDFLDARIAGRRSRDIVVVTIDTLRHDGLRVLGGSANTPNLDRFINEGRLFTQAWAQFPSTRHAMNALFTGRYPVTLGFDPKTEKVAEQLRITESLDQAGYETLAFTSFPHDLLAREKKHLEHGFAVFENDEGDRAERSKRTINRALEALEVRKDPGKPVFLWIHLFDPHGPYTERGDGGSLRDRYDREIEHADYCLGELFDALRNRGKRPLIVLHSDHGEEFQDHGGLGHNSSLYDEQIRVPLVFHGAGIEPGRSDHPVELLDLGATLREYVGLPLHGPDAGHSLVPILTDRPRDTWPAPVCFSQFRFPLFVNGNLDAVREGNWKLIHDRNLGLYELFDLDSDAGEKVNLATSEPEELARLQKVLRTVRHYTGAPPEDDKEEKADLEFLKDAVERVFDDQGFEEFRTVLRRNTELGEAALAPLLDHEEARVRTAVLVHLATWGGEGGATLLRTRLDAEERGRQVEARTMLAIMGEESRLDALPLLLPEFQGDKRILSMLARVAAGDRSLAPAVHQLFCGPEGDQDVENLIIRTMLRMKDVDFLPSLYGRISMGKVTLEHVVSALGFVDVLPIEVISPIVRRILCSPDQGLRQLARQTIAGRERYQAWEPVAVAAEQKALQARHLFNGQKEVIQQCLKLLSDGAASLAERGVLDWGLALDLSFVVNSWGSRRDLVPMLQGLRDRDAGKCAFACGVIDRLLEVARTSTSRPSGRIELLEGQAFGKSEFGLVPLLVRVTLEPDSKAVVGGFAWQTEYLGAKLFDEQGGQIGIPLALLLPTTGVLPGEDMVLAVQVVLPPDAGPRFRMGIRLGRGEQDVFPPIIRDIER